MKFYENRIIEKNIRHFRIEKRKYPSLSIIHAYIERCEIYMVKLSGGCIIVRDIDSKIRRNRLTNSTLRKKILESSTSLGEIPTRRVWKERNISFKRVLFAYGFPHPLPVGVPLSVVAYTRRCLSFNRVIRARLLRSYVEEKRRGGEKKNDGRSPRLGRRERGRRGEFERGRIWIRQWTLTFGCALDDAERRRDGEESA